MNLLKLIKKHGGKWVALKPDSDIVVSSGRNVEKVYSEAKKKGISIPTLFKVPTKNTAYIG